MSESGREEVRGGEEEGREKREREREREEKRAHPNASQLSRERPLLG